MSYFLLPSLFRKNSVGEDENCVPDKNFSIGFGVVIAIIIAFVVIYLLLMTIGKIN